MRLVTTYWPDRNLASDLFDEMDRYFGDFSRVSPRSAYEERPLDPACEISESDDHFFMSVDLPGMKKDNIKIEIENNVLSLSGERKRVESNDKKDKNQRQEKSYGAFKRSFTLPVSIEANKVEARYEDGVLELYLPKTQAAKSRLVEIQTGKEGIFDKLLGSKKTNSELKDVGSH